MGAPQGTVLSPFLFSVCTPDCQSSHTDYLVVKYADDTAQMGLTTDNDDTHYQQEIDNLVQWCGRNYLDLCILVRQREMVIDFWWKTNQPGPVVLKGGVIERVETSKHLGGLFDSTLSWKQNTNRVLKKAHTHLFVFGIWSLFVWNKKLLQMFYSSVLSSILTFSLSSWGGMHANKTRSSGRQVVW